MDSFIDEVVAIADAVAAKRRSAKRIMLSFDEWNVWYRTRRNRQARVKEGWPVAPPILEEIYNVEDALAFGGCCISLLNHADRVTAACLAQLVNVIAPIMTETGGSAWRQTIFHPFAHFSRLGRGRVLTTEIDSPTYSTRYNDPNGPIDEFFPMTAVPYLKLAAVHNENAQTLTLFALNRHLTEEMPLRLSAGGFATLAVKQALQLHNADLMAANTSAQPDRVAPQQLAAIRVDGSRLEATLAPASWNVIQLAVSGSPT
jgi:alpha-N-arabinofuranosidase